MSCKGKKKSSKYAKYSQKSWGSQIYSLLLLLIKRLIVKIVSKFLSSYIKLVVPCWHGNVSKELYIH